jgi:hypothetical protein
VRGRAPTRGGVFLRAIFGGGGYFSWMRVSTRTVDAPSSAEPITCEDDPAVRSGNAAHVAGLNGFSPSTLTVGRQLRIRWSTGSQETYVNRGMGWGSLWMQPVAGTCTDG